MVRQVKKTTVLLAAMAAAGIPLITTATCNPYSRTLSLFRDDDYRDRDFGILDWFIDDYYYSDCWYDCGYDDYWVEEVIFYP